VYDNERGNPSCQKFGPNLEPSFSPSALFHRHFTVKSSSWPAARLARQLPATSRKTRRHFGRLAVSPYERDGACFGGCRAAPSTAARGFLRIARAPGEEARDIFRRRGGGRVDAGMESSAPLSRHVLR